MVLNSDAGGGLLSEEDGEPFIYGIQAAEKVYADFMLTSTDEGGHSSRPDATNAIHELAQALDRIARHEFPARQNEITRAYFQASAAKKTGPVGEAMKRFAADATDAQAISTLSQEREFIGLVRTTCVVTQVEGGHAPNALPQRATANVNCRIFPGTPVASVKQTLATVIGNDRIQIAEVDSGSVESDASPLRPDVIAAVTKAVRAVHGDVPIVPNMSQGATDSMHFRALGIPSYGVSGLFMKASDDYSHGLNERAPVAAIDGALVHWEILLKALAK